MKKIIIYTDGSCKENPGYGGWASILFFQGYKKKLYGSYKRCTNNQMEILAIVSALLELDYPCKIKIMTDSRYVKKGISHWIYIWKYNKNIYIEEEEKRNEKLWKILYNICKNKKHIIEWYWIKSHNLNKYNIKIDYLSKIKAKE